MLSEPVLRAVSSAEPTRAAPSAAGQETQASAVPAVIAPATPNPRLRLDGRLGMVVLEFRGSGGEVANTIPSPRVIAAYRAAAISAAPVPLGVQPQTSASTNLPPDSSPSPAPEPA